jgi:translation initiation factor 2 alpha subunit (eIF-2alpha)
LEAIEGKYSKNDKAKAQTAKNILEPASKNTRFKNGNLKTEITYKLTESEVALNDDIKFAEDNKIEEAKQDKSETAKALLEKAKKKITETQLTKLLEVID